MAVAGAPYPQHCHPIQPQGKIRPALPCEQQRRNLVTIAVLLVGSTIPNYLPFPQPSNPVVPPPALVKWIPAEKFYP